MKSPLRTTTSGGPATALALLLLPAAVFATEPPVNTRPPVDRVVEEVESLHAPAADVVDPDPAEPMLFAVPLVATPVAPDAAQRGAVLTDASAGRPAAAPTAAERAKLDAARAAIEASRAAGTLFVRSLPEDTTPATPEELAAMKRQQLEARSSVAPPADPVAGIGNDLRSVQETGPSGLTPAEEAKLRGEVLPEQPLPPPSVEVPAYPTGDGATLPSPLPPVRKETRDE